MNLVTQSYAHNLYLDAQLGAAFNPMHHDNVMPPPVTGMDNQNYKTTGGANTVANLGLRLGMLSHLKNNWFFKLGCCLSYWFGAKS